MDNSSELEDWPKGSAFAIFCGPDFTAEPKAFEGNLDQVREWASVTKLAVALAAARGVDRGDVVLEQPAGPDGSTLAHLLAHASGLGLEASDRHHKVGSRRVYSNVGIDTAVTTILQSRQPSTWLRDEVFGPLAMSDAHLDGRPAAGGRGSLHDLAKLGAGWLCGPIISDSTRARFTSTFLPELSGVVPGFGRFDPCPWGLGVEIHGVKRHWMGTKFSTRAYGHFGQSGAFMLVDPEHHAIVVAAAGAPFGEWAHEVWPLWMDRTFDRYVGT